MYETRQSLLTTIVNFVAHWFVAFAKLFFVKVIHTGVRVSIEPPTKSQPVAYQDQPIWIVYDQSDAVPPSVERDILSSSSEHSVPSKSIEHDKMSRSKEWVSLRPNTEEHDDWLRSNDRKLS